MKPGISLFTDKANLNKLANQSCDHFVKSSQAHLNMQRHAKESAVGYKPLKTSFFTGIDTMKHANDSYEHFRSAQRGSLTCISGQSLSSSIGRGVISTGKKAISSYLEEKAPGVGNYIGKKLTFVTAGSDFLKAREKSLQRGNSENAAFVCGMANTSSKVVTKSVGYHTLIPVTVAVAAGPAGPVAAFSVFTAGTIVVESGSKFVGDAVQHGCESLFKSPEKTNIPVLPKYNHY